MKLLACLCAGLALALMIDLQTARVALAQAQCKQVDCPANCTQKTKMAADKARAYERCMANCTKVCK